MQITREKQLTMLTNYLNPIKFAKYLAIENSVQVRFDKEGD